MAYLLLQSQNCSTDQFDNEQKQCMDTILFGGNFMIFSGVKHFLLHDNVKEKKWRHMCGKFVNVGFVFME